MSSEQSELGQARRERDEAEARFHITFDANPAPSMIVHLEDARVVATNPDFHQLSGRQNDEVNGHLIRKLGLFSEVDEFERLLVRLRRGESITKETLVMVSQTQGARTMVVSAKPIELDAGPCGIFNFTDVTELNDALEATRRSEKRFSQAFTLSPIPAVISTLGRETFLEVNEAFLKLTGYADDEIIGKSAFDLGMWSSRDDQDKIMEAQADGKGFRELELHLRSKDGTIYDVLLSAEVIRIDGEPGYLKMFYDISDRKQTERELAEALRQVVSDTTWFSRQVMERLGYIRAGEPNKRMVQLTGRERDILERISQGWGNKRIAQDLSLNEQTVRNYISNLYSKLNVHTRAEAIVWARERNIGS